jgi:hypothetical protein
MLVAREPLTNPSILCNPSSHFFRLHFRSFYITDKTYSVFSYGEYWRFKAVVYRVLRQNSETKDFFSKQSKRNQHIVRDCGSVDIAVLCIRGLEELCTRNTHSSSYKVTHTRVCLTPTVIVISRKILRYVILSKSIPRFLSYTPTYELTEILTRARQGCEQRKSESKNGGSTNWEK